MSNTSQDLLNTFDVLPLADQQDVALEICRRVAQWESSPLEDEHLDLIADESFQELDQSEASN